MKGTLTNPVFSLATFFGVSFLLHLLWENAQAPLFQGYESFAQHFTICLKATIGDLLFMLIIYLALTTLHRDLLWITNRSVYSYPTTWIVTLSTGMLLAIFFEFWAVHIAHHWTYSPTMPLIPLLEIGLTPLLQIIVVPSIVLLVSRSSLQQP